ncbi:MAG: serine hydrolase domain-containing protein [Bacteroidales bacterium]
MKRKILYLNLAAFLLLQSACLKEENLNGPYTGYTPETIGDSWIISSPDKELMDSQLIDQVYRDFFDENRYPTAQSLLIVRHGKLVAEGYCKDENDLYSLHNIKSATKSITSILTGIMLDIGGIESLESMIYDYLPEYFDDDGRKRSITIRQVLTMETGLNFIDDVHTREMLYHPGSSLRFVLEKDLVFEPGTDWFYGDGNPQLISGLIQKLTGVSESEFAEKYLLTPLGITNYMWETTKDSLTLGSIGLWLAPRDMAKIGLLMANQGTWNGTRVVAESWINESTRRQSLFQNYGYYWYPLEDKAFYAEGHGGQLIWVYPEYDLVVVITSDPYTKSWKISESYGSIFNGIITSLRDRD